MKANRPLMCNDCGKDIKEGTEVKELVDKHYRAFFHKTCRIPQDRCPDCWRYQKVCADCAECACANEQEETK